MSNVTKTTTNFKFNPLAPTFKPSAGLHFTVRAQSESPTTSASSGSSINDSPPKLGSPIKLAASTPPAPSPSPAASPSAAPAFCPIVDSSAYIPNPPVLNEQELKEQAERRARMATYTVNNQMRSGMSNFMTYALFGGEENPIYEEDEEFLRMARRAARRARGE